MKWAPGNEFWLSITNDSVKAYRTKSLRNQRTIEDTKYPIELPI